MIWNIPNILSVFRLIAAPLLPVVVVLLPRPISDWAALILFVGASVTDWIDGYLARAWNQTTKFGAMIDPIADKAMVLSALLVLAGTSGLNPWIVIPASAIVFREVFVSGLREFLGETAGLLKVTKLAKWKTATQMTAITLILINALFQHSVAGIVFGMGEEMYLLVMRGDMPDELGVIWRTTAMEITWYGGLSLFWIAGALTLVTGWDYFSKARPYLEEDA